jgi:hypothetical protein
MIGLELLLNERRRRPLSLLLLFIHSLPEPLSLLNRIVAAIFWKSWLHSAPLIFLILLYFRPPY